MSHDHSAVIREPVTEAGRDVVMLVTNGIGLHDPVEHIVAIEAEAIAAERLRVKELMEQGSGDGLNFRFCLPASVAREILGETE